MMESMYTSMGNKLLHHPKSIQDILDQRPRPVSLQIAPTSRCNANCVFCSNSKRSKHEDLPVSQIKSTLQLMSILRAKTVEWTGGGDPTMYHSINEVIDIAHGLGYKQGFITNGGILKKKVCVSSLEHLSWLRVSMNWIDYNEAIELPDVPNHVTLGFSYVMNEATTKESLARLDDMVLKYKPRYVRMVPNCLSDIETQRANNKHFKNFFKDWKAPYFYQAKNFQKPTHCWWGYFKPFLLHDGYVYPCSSVVLNSGAEGKFHERYRWTKIDNLFNIYVNSIIQDGVDPIWEHDCDHCVFTAQNEMIEGLLNPNGMEDFI